MERLRKIIKASSGFKSLANGTIMTFLVTLKKPLGRALLSKTDASMAAVNGFMMKIIRAGFYVDSTGSYVESLAGRILPKRGGYMAKVRVFDLRYDSWYYLNQDSTASNQWIKDGDKWYCFSDGEISKNMTISGYKVNKKKRWNGFNF